MKYVIGFIIGLIMSPIFMLGGPFVLTELPGIQYTRDGTLLCSSRGSGRECLVLTSFVPANKLQDVAPSARGFIGCIDGHWTVRNIDFANYIIPADRSIIGPLDDKWCSN